MERLTYDFCVGGVHCWQIRGADNDLCEVVCMEHEENGCKECPIGKAFDRLAAIENILGDEYDLSNLRDLLQAKQDGRLVVLPCKVGDTVFRVLTTRDCPPVISELKIKTVGQAADLIGRIGKRKLLSYYLTREDAEAVLKGGSE